MRLSTARAPAISKSAAQFLDLFYPVHYKVGIGIEDALRGGRLTRHQVAVLWLIHVEGEDGVRIARKEIERLITRWFEIGNSAISKSLGAMSRAPLSLLEVQLHPESGRERQVQLTDQGRVEVRRMIEDGRRFIQTMVDHLTGEESRQGVHFLSRVSGIIDVVEPAGRGGKRR